MNKDLRIKGRVNELDLVYRLMRPYKNQPFKAAFLTQLTGWNPSKTLQFIRDYKFIFPSEGKARNVQYKLLLSYKPDETKDAWSLSQIAELGLSRNCKERNRQEPEDNTTKDLKKRIKESEKRISKLENQVKELTSFINQLDGLPLILEGFKTLMNNKL